MLDFRRSSALQSVSEPTHPDDRALASQAKGGDDAAVARVTARMACIPRYLASRNRRRGGLFSPDDLRDLTQEAIVIIWKKLDRFRGEASLETWWCAIAGGVFMNAFRKRLRQRTRSLDGDFSESADQLVAIDAPAEPDRYADLTRCLQRLPQREAEVVKARAFDAQEFEVIASQSGLSLSGLKSVYYRALRKLEACLGSRSSLEVASESET